MRIAHISFYFKVPRFLLLNLVVPIKVEADHFRGRQAFISAKRVRTAEALIICIVQAAKERYSAVIRKARSKQTIGIAPFIADSEVNICNPRIIERLLCRNIQHRHLFPVVYARLLSVVALFVIRFNLAYDVRRQVFHHRFGISFEEVFTIDQELFDRFAIPSDGTIVAHAYTRQLLNQRFDCRACRRAICRCVKLRRISNLLHSRCASIDDGRCERILFRLHTYDAQISRFVVIIDRNVAKRLFVARITKPHKITTGLVHTDYKLPKAISQRTSDKGAVALLQK